MVVQLLTHAIKGSCRLGPPAAGFSNCCPPFGHRQEVEAG
jgi:hypothetical protein